jgi:hypothetical protein
MPSTNIPVKSHTSRNGTVLGAGTSADVTNGNNVANDGNTRILCVGGAAAKTMTFVTTSAVDGMALADLTVSVGITENKIFGPFPVALFGTTLEITHEAASTTKLTPFNDTSR